MPIFKKLEDGGFKRVFKNEHVTLRAVRLVTDSDRFDTLVEQTERLCYRGTTETLSGQIFIATERTERVATVIIVPAPDFAMPSARIEDKVLTVDSCGYPAYVTECPSDLAERTVRDWYRTQYSPKVIHAMSNTWGDRNGRTRVCDEFIRQEIESGADLGLDVVQIDDGWQMGVPDKYDSEGERLFEGNFWELKEEIFPEGIGPLAKYARERGVELGLWFAPHSRGVFEHFDRDISVLRSAYHDWSIRYFKLDMVNLPSRAHCDRMIDLLESVRAFGEVSTELDVTANKRLGYLAAAPYGTIFVENRYTAWASYYPHRTLRNLWMLSRFIPTSKMQFELVNPDLYTDRYDPEDPFRHGLYDADYLFASVMLSNPLFWMETQFLSEKARADLKSIIPLWKQYREAFTHADVRPIGAEPSGASLTGFIADTGDSVHLLLFREATEIEDTFLLEVGFEPTAIEVIKEKVKSEIYLDGSGIMVTIPEPRSYTWIKLKK